MKLILANLEMYKLALDEDGTKVEEGNPPLVQVAGCGVHDNANIVRSVKDQEGKVADGGTVIASAARSATILFENGWISKPIHAHVS